MAVSVFVSACGSSSGSDSDSSSSGDGSLYGSTTVSGSISGQSGGQSRMSGWVVVLTERDTGISRVGEVNASGIFSIPGVRPSVAHGLTLLSPDYLVRGVFAVPSETTAKLQTFFTMTKSYLPRFIHRGYVVTPQSLDGISLTSDSVADSDGDGSPDGLSSLGLAGGLSSVDLDQDGVVNDIDPDIDGDGLLNWFDPDDDADGLSDVVDTDANGNLVIDTAESVSDQNFRTGVEYFTVSVEVRPSGSTTNTYLSLATKVRKGVTPKSVQVRGPQALLNGSVIEATDTAPQSAWDKLLLDDGNSEDGFADDLIYARKVLLGSGKSPRPNQSLFLQLGFGDTSSPVFAEFPFTFPAVDLGSLAFTWNGATRTVAKTSTSAPFGSLTSYSWSISISNSDGVKVYESPLVSADTSSIVIPDRLLDSGSTYTFEASAQLLDRIPGYPAFVVYSPTQSITR
ncbi:hypothetical protein EBZ80_14065 [bacterium]|nr:hypothetical protein [bacterium]